MINRVRFLLLSVVLSCSLLQAETEVIADARHTGDFGLRVTTLSGEATFLTNEDIDVPDAFRARFYFRLDQLELMEDQQIPIFVGRDASETHLFRLIIGRKDDVNRIGFQVLLDNGSYAEIDAGTGIALPGGWRCVEFSWSSSDGDGYMQYILDGATQAGLNNLSNSLSQLASVQIGLLAKGASGFVDFDDYESRERGAIGSLCTTPTEIYGLLPNWPLSESILNLSTLIQEACSRF